MKISLFVLLALCLTSCGLKKIQGKTISEEGSLYYKPASNDLQIPVFGDYLFHPFGGKYFPFTSKAFLNFVKAGSSDFHPRLLYSAHTIIQPYYAVAALVYPNKANDSAALGFISEGVQAKLLTKLSGVTRLQTKNGDVVRLDYRVLNPRTKLHTTNRDYLISRNGNLYRFLFWTINSDTAIVFHEADAIINALKFYQE